MRYISHGNVSRRRSFRSFLSPGGPSIKKQHGCRGSSAKTASPYYTSGKQGNWSKRKGEERPGWHFRRKKKRGCRGVLSETSSTKLRQQGKLWSKRRGEEQRRSHTKKKIPRVQSFEPNRLSFHHLTHTSVRPKSFGMRSHKEVVPMTTPHARKVSRKIGAGSDTPPAPPDLAGDKHPSQNNPPRHFAEVLSNRISLRLGARSTPKQEERKYLKYFGSISKLSKLRRCVQTITRLHSEPTHHLKTKDCRNAPPSWPRPVQT